MKKLFLLLCVVSFVFVSCSSDDSTENLPAPAGNRLKKMVVKDHLNGQYYQIHSTAEFFYNENKLDRIIDENGYTTRYYYTGDLITSLIYSTGRTVSFTYDNQERLIKRRVFGNGLVERHTDFTYNSDGTITFHSYNITPTAPPDDRNFKVFFEANNVVRVEEYVEVVTVGGTTSYTTKKRYQLDTKNSPTSAILGLSKLINYDGDLSLSLRNVLSITYNDFTTPDQIRDYSYNQNDFPVTMVVRVNPGLSAQLLYEYTYE